MLETERNKNVWRRPIFNNGLKKKEEKEFGSPRLRQNSSIRLDENFEVIVDKFAKTKNYHIHILYENLYHNSKIRF